MDARYMGALKAFLSHNPSEMPINPGAPDPLRDRGPDVAAPVRRPKLAGSAAGSPTGVDLLPLIFAQLPLETSYRVK